MELHQLEYVLAVAKFQSFTKAAENINVSQSSLSIQISKLEAEIGTRLFDRTTRTVILTAAGREFLPYAQDICNGERRLWETMKLYSQTDQGIIKTGIMDCAHLYGFSDLILSFGEKHPDVSFDIYEAEGTSLTDMLYSNEIDAAFIINPIKRDNMLLYPLVEDELALAVSHTHRFAGRDGIDISELENETLIFSESGTIYNDLMRVLKTEDQRINIDFYLTHNSGILNNVGLASKGIGITFLSSRIAHGYEHIGFSIVKLTPRIPRMFCMVSTKQTMTRPLIKNFFNQVMETFPKQT